MKTKNVITTLLLLALLAPASAIAQKKEKEGKKLREEKEWVTERGKKVLDHMTKYNAKGDKIEEIEYAAYGQKERITYEYNAEGRLIKESYFDDRDKLAKYIVPEYDARGVKAKETTFLPNNKVKSVKEFEYIY